MGPPCVCPGIERFTLIENRAYDCARRPPPYDILSPNAQIYDRRGSALVRGELAFKGDQIDQMEPAVPGRTLTMIEAVEKAVTHGFVNMLICPGGGI